MRNKKAYKLYNAGKHQEAEKVLIKSLEKNKYKSDFDLNLLGMIHYQSRRYESAITLFNSAIKLNNTDANYYNNLGAVYKDSNDALKAIDAFMKAIELNNSFPEALYNLGSTYQLMGDFEKAEFLLRKAIECKPGFTVAQNNLACVQMDRGKAEEAIVLFEDIVRQEPDNYAIFSNKLFTMNYLGLFPEFLFERHKEYYQNYININNPIDSNSKFLTYNNKKIRIGYMSPDFRLHSVSYFIYPIIKNHDLSQFEIFCYADVALEDVVTGYYKKFTNLKNIYYLSHEEVYKIILNDKIDILVDLTGHSARNRLPVFINRPAPKQVTYLGYPNTTGIPQIEYRLTDNFVDDINLNTDQFYTEKLIRLDDIFLNYYPGYKPVEIVEPPCIKNKYITYGSFNNRAKLNNFILDLWAIILKTDENSRLVLKSSINSDEFLQNNILNEFSNRDVNPTRITISPYLDFDQHLKLYQTIDVALDTYPYNGTTTTCEALWSGVPVITLLGTEHRSRVSADILNNINLSSCVAHTPDEYIEKAFKTAHNINFLNFWRAKHKTQMEQSGLMAYKKTTENIEKIYKQIHNGEI